jgi:hypothetical protein
VTRTEERLADALQAVASQITDDSLALAADPDQVAPGRFRRIPAGRWLVPVSSAAAVLAVIAFAVVVPRIGSAGPFADAGSRNSPPPFYVSVDVNDQIIVHSTATGQITGRIPQPEWDGGGNFTDAAVASGNGGQFVVAMNDWSALRTRIYSFGLTSSGQIEGLTQLAIRVPGLTELSAALSPDGSGVALAGVPDAARSVSESAGPPHLLVVNLRSGAVRTWASTPEPGGSYRIEDPAWSARGRAVRFLLEYCRGGRAAGINATCPDNWPAAQEWTIGVPRGTGPLGPARSIAALPPGTSQAAPIAGPAIVAFSVNDRYVVVGRYTMSGRLVSVLYRAATPDYLESAYLSVDASGRYVILNEGRSSVFGWLRRGRLVQLSTKGQLGFDELLSSAW